MRFISVALAASCLAGPVVAEDVKVGILMGFTGPLESVAPAMAAAAEMAMDEANAAGTFLNGGTVEAVRGDDTCIDAGSATAAAERMIGSDGVVAIVGTTCSGAASAVLQNVARPRGVVMVSPSATSPGLSSIEDDDLFFRTAPSDARQGEVLAQMMSERGIERAAITYTNNDYGKGLSTSIADNFKALGGTVTIVAAHEDGKADYSAEVASLAAAGGDALVIAGYLDQGGKGIAQSVIDLDAFDTFVLPDGMIGQSLLDALGNGLDGSFGVLPGTEGQSAELFGAMARKVGFEIGPYSAESYDAAALILLAMQAAKSTNGQDFKASVMTVANAPGEKILPGELARAFDILSDGGDIDYVGASGVELIGSGESSGNFREISVEDGGETTVGYR